MEIDYSPQTLYRMPWNFTDNAISWLEPTSKCNLYCDGCYRENRKDSHKTLEEISHELDVFQKLRKCDSISVAGGEPLTHPDIVEIVRMIKRKGWKPVINTNGDLLTEELLKELKEAGVTGFTFHIDSGQNRPGWKGETEIELNELRTKYARMVARAGKITCSFNATIYPETVHYVPELLKWAQDNIRYVHVMVFIIYRMAILGKNNDFYVGDQKVYFDDMTYSTADDKRSINIKSTDIVDEIRKTQPDFMPHAFLNGTADPNSFKWLFTGRMGNRRKIFGYVGPKFMELVQTVKHIFTGSYLAYADPTIQSKGRIYFPIAIFDKGMRQIIKSYFNSFIDDPLAFFNRICYQTVLIIQPADVEPSGDVNMCDGCPDITVWNDQLVWSCRMEEQFRWGQNVRVVLKSETEVEKTSNI